MALVILRKPKILNGCGKPFKDFIQREWLSVFVSSAIGVAGAALIRLTLWDHAFEGFVASKYFPTQRIFDDPRLYFPYIIGAGVTVFLAAALRLPIFVGRYLRSLWEGVTSGLCLVSFTVTFVAFTFSFSSIQRQLAFAAATLLIAFPASFLLHMRARTRVEKTPSEDDLRVSPYTRSLVGTKRSESDDPIRTWEEDLLGRACLVDSISVKLMISKSPVIALFGPLGSGKTSTLNLLREHLSDKAIVIFFSTWLPGSQDTFTAYLLSDIANECQKHYQVPGLRKSTKRFARALGKNVPLLQSYFDSLPEPTQRDDIKSIHAALERLPQRIIVLLDELDRMEKEELITLLKVIRGVSHLPNLSFVCAGDFKTIVETVKGDFKEENREYFEKFFFDIIDIPPLDAAALKKAGIDRLAVTLKRRGWFESPTDEEEFRAHTAEIWDQRIAPFCRNLRGIGLLANALAGVAAPLIKEVDPVDLTLIELLRRFRPQVYNIVGNNSVALTGGAGLFRGEYHPDREKDSLEKKLIADIQKAAPEDKEFRQVKGILRELFPRFRERDREESWEIRLEHYSQRDDADLDIFSSKRIRNPDLFPAYFRYELPGAMYSSVELAAFLRRMNDAVKAGNEERVFQETLDSMEKGSPQRDDFLRKVAGAAQKSISLPTGKALVHAAMRTAHEYTYDMLAAFGEAGHVLRLVLRMSLRLHLSQRRKLLQECILEATDDTMAFNILTRLTAKQADVELGISLPELYPTFTKRMRGRYGRDVDAAKVDLSTSDPWSFNYWGLPTIDGITIDPEDRAIQRDFWLRYIGNSRARLAQTFRGFFLPASVSYTSDVTPFVENKIPVEDLRKLYEQLPDDEILNDVDRQSLRTLRRLLDGEFKNGADIGLYSDEAGATA